MNKEIKQEKNKNRNKTYAVIVAVVAVLVAFVIFKPSHNTQNTETTKAPEVQTVETKEETTIARIDITTPLVDATKPQFEVYVNDSEEPEKQNVSMPKFDVQGYVIQKDNGNEDIKLKALKNADISIVLRGRWEKNDNDEIIEHWVKYTSLAINDEEILPEAVEVWHNDPFRYTINAKAGEEYKIHVEWQKDTNK